MPQVRMAASSLMFEPVTIATHTFENPQHFLRLPVSFNLYTLPSYTRDIPPQQFAQEGLVQLAAWSTHPKQMRSEEKNKETMNKHAYLLSSANARVARNFFDATVDL
ncbi:hypothetical protein T03_724 [Trichinella britovi]|uniref:Uncharacterized protein n=1 Tax=Trichinella britovi TaxID=45882 RepID=A0A0V1C6E0_TRIBR|nr:hypothetical protein T03_724 [Trichinella britovi]